MLEHDNKGIFGNTGHGLLKVASGLFWFQAFIFHTCKIDSFPIPFHVYILIEQQVPAHFMLFLLHLRLIEGCRGVVGIHIEGIVVVAKNTEHTVVRLQLTENGHHGIQFIGLHILQVAREDNHIGLLGIDAVNGFPE